MYQNNFYINPTVSKKALAKFFEIFNTGRNELHSLQIYHKNRLLVRFAAAPYRAHDKKEVYSMSKSFSSTAIGFLFDEGKLSVEDRIVDIFPDKLPETVSENLSKMRLKDVLSMTTGHANCSMNAMIHSDDPIRAFLAAPVEYEPGAHFVYDTGASCLLSCIAEKFSGMKMMDYLTWKLFLPLGIHGVTWNKVRDGNNEGGCGLHLSTDDITKFGLLYLNKGKWNGKQILSEKWIEAATSRASSAFEDEAPDWCAGYGYQFWYNASEGYRADGAYGQMCVVLPDRDMVIALQECLGDGFESHHLVELADHILDVDDTQTLILPSFAPTGSAQKTAGFENNFYKLEENLLGWTGIYFIYDTDNDAMQAVFSNGVSQQTITAGNGYYADSTVYVKKLKPKIVSLMATPDTEVCPLASSYTAEDGKLVFNVRFRNCPNKVEITFTEEDGKLNGHVHSGGLLESGASNLTGYICS